MINWNTPVTRGRTFRTSFTLLYIFFISLFKIYPPNVSFLTFYREIIKNLAYIILIDIVYKETITFLNFWFCFVVSTKLKVLLIYSSSKPLLIFSSIHVFRRKKLPDDVILVVSLFRTLLILVIRPPISFGQSISVVHRNVKWVEWWYTFGNIIFPFLCSCFIMTFGKTIA